MRRLLLILPLAALLLSSCRKDEQLVDLTAVIVDQPGRGGAKVYVDDARYACWHHGDAVNVNGSNYTLSVEPGTLTAEHDWRGQKVAKILDVNKSSNGYTAAYPASCVSGISEGGTSVTVTIPSVQTYSRATVYDGTGDSYQQLVNPMVAHCGAEDDTLKFRNVGCVLKVTVYNSSGAALNLHYVTVKTENAYLAGSASMTIAGSTLTETPSIGVLSSGYHGITVDCHSTPIPLANGADTVLYLVSAPFTDQTLIVRVLAKDEDDNYYTLTATSNGPLSLSRNQMGQASFNVGNCSCTEESIIPNQCNYAFWGCGTRRHPFLITNKEDLLRFRGFTHLADEENNSARSLYARNTSVYYEQICDVDASDAVWTDNGQFWGHYNGGGYAIKLKLGSRAYPGLFASLSGATISNLTLTGDAVSISSSNILSAGVFCGDILRTSGSDKTVFENCVNRIPISARYTGSSIGDGSSLNLVGGIVARAIVSGCKVTFRNCSNEASITGSTSDSGPYIYTGGLLGSGYCDSVINCSNSGTIVGKSNTGGFIGHSDWSTTLFGSNTNTGSVSGTQRVGGMVGYVTYLLRINGVATNSGSVTGTGMNTGGILGRSDTIFTLSANSHITNSGVVSGTTNVGGIAGYVSKMMFVNQGVVVRNVAGGNVSGSGNYVGGCIGYVGVFASNGTTNYSFSNAASVTGSSTSVYVGGIVGSCGNYSASNGGTTYYSLIYHCTNSAAVSGKCSVGGIAGFARCKVMKFCINRSSATLTADAAANSGTGLAGLIGTLGGSSILTIDSCKNEASLSHSGSNDYLYVAGLVGYGGSAIRVKNSCNTGNMSMVGDFAVAGLIGQFRATIDTIQNCYNSGNVTWSKRTGGADSYYVGGLATAYNVSVAIVDNSYFSGTLNRGTSTYYGDMVAFNGANTTTTPGITQNINTYSVTNVTNRTSNSLTSRAHYTFTNSDPYQTTNNTQNLLTALNAWQSNHTNYSTWTQTGTALPHLSWEDESWAR